MLSAQELSSCSCRKNLESVDFTVLGKALKTPSAFWYWAWYGGIISLAWSAEKKRKVPDVSQFVPVI